MIIELHDKLTKKRVGIDVRQINYFVENFAKDKDGNFTTSDGTAVFVCGNDPFLASESFEQVKELIESAGKKH